MLDSADTLEIRLKNACYNSAKKFNVALNQVALTQETIFKKIISKNSDTAFGKLHSFATLNTIKNYQNTVPVSTYEDYEKFIERIKLGESEVLTKEKVLLLEPTSGSTGNKKYIPYTKSLFNEFKNGITPWLYDIFSSRPNLTQGLFYWSITPAGNQHELSSGGIPIGFGNDFSYFSRKQQSLLKSRLAVPFTLNLNNEQEIFHRETLKYLLTAENLTFISIWSPSFLISLLEYLTHNAEKILPLISNKKRQLELENHFQEYDTNYALLYKKIWPHLSLISCWSEGAASHYIEQLKNIFPNTEIQGKGLLATEAFVSLPLFGQEGCVLAINSHFFEFKQLETATIVLAHELKIGEQYEVIVTTSGGLYRYNLNDIIEVTGFVKQCPLIKFIGRNGVIDHTGEKINELQLSVLIQSALAKLQLNTQFLLFAADRCDNHFPLNYIFLIDAVELDKNKAKQLAEFFEDNLNKNYHYQYSRKMNQLGPVKIFKISNSGKSANQIYLDECVKSGKTLGNIKPALISKEIGWLKKFTGVFL